MVNKGALREVLNTEAGILVVERLIEIKTSMEKRALQATRVDDLGNIRLASGRVEAVEVILKDFEDIKKGKHGS